MAKNKDQASQNAVHSETFYFETKDFTKVSSAYPIPDLIQIQKHSYADFMDETENGTGIREVLDEHFPLEKQERKTLKISLPYERFKVEREINTVAKCKSHDYDYTAPIKILAKLQVQYNPEERQNGIHSNDEVRISTKKEDVFIGEFPKMTEAGTFIINGGEKVIISQLIRSPGVYFFTEKDKFGTDLFNS
ncbi:MAG: hypothetical protein LBM99_03155, partial [Bacillales bacterium]|nr:hypothetical protein [Bacillales bacterium]